MSTDASLPYGIRPPAFRLPDRTRVGQVRLAVASLQRSIDYYQHVIGLQVRERSGAVARLTAADGPDTLIELYEEPAIQAAPRRGAYGLYHFAILLPSREDLGRFIAHVAGLGIRLGAADHWVSEAIYLTDPDGLGIEVYADRPRSAWQVRGQELAMSTDQLDLRDLVAAGGDQPWQGAPAGTTMGHVHLHVGDLAGAEAFYHRALGFDKVVWGYPGALFLSAGGYHHHLGTNTWSPGPAASTEHARLIEWQLILPTVSDVATAGASLEGAGYKVGTEGASLTVRDPWGTGLRIAPSVGDSA
ncbi:MAG: VOC family protein [Vicinamibacterales bacterium]